MNKKIYSTFIILCFATLAFAQTPMMGNRAFTQSTKPYTSLTGATIAIASFDWDDPAVAIPLPFSFELLGRNFSGNMFMSADISIAGFTNTSNSSATTNCIFGMFHDIRNRNNANFPNGANNSEIRYRTDSTAGNRILKVELANIGFLDDQTNTAFANVQFWWYEADSAYEIHFGNAQLTDSTIADTLYEGRLMFGAIKDLDANNGGWTKLYSVVDNPTLTIDSMSLIDASNENFKGVTSWPTAGTVWRFAYPKVGFPAAVHNFADQSQIEVYTSIINDVVQFRIANMTQALSYSLYNSNGAKLSEGTCQQGANSITAANLSSGLYLLAISDGKQNVVYKVHK
jgi:hypothetical protein